MSHTSRAKYATRPATFLAREVRAEIIETEIAVEADAREHDAAVAARVAAWEEAECWERDYLEHAREQDRAREDEYLYFMMEMDDQ